MKNHDLKDASKMFFYFFQMVSLLQLDSIVSLGSFGGRLDHVCANFNTLYLAQTFTEMPITLLSETSLAMLLPKVRSWEIVWMFLLEQHCYLKKIISNVITWQRLWQIGYHFFNVIMEFSTIRFDKYSSVWKSLAMLSSKVRSWQHGLQIS